jgi:hypothetical protein
MIVVNRGNGNAKYKFNYCFLQDKIMNQEYLVENHLNMIIGDIDKLKIVFESFKNPNTNLFLEQYCRNNGLSKTEIECILPIYK